MAREMTRLLAWVQPWLTALMVAITTWAGTQFMQLRDLTRDAQAAIEAIRREGATLRDGDQREILQRFDGLGTRVVRLEAARERDDRETQTMREAVARLTAVTEQLDRTLRGVGRSADGSR